jgi:hypothetical protein
MILTLPPQLGERVVQGLKNDHKIQYLIFHFLKSLSVEKLQRKVCLGRETFALALNMAQRDPI